MTHQVEGTCVPVEYVVLGMLDNNVYIIGDGETTMAVDPSCQAGDIVAALGGRKLDVILLTHRHFDHVGAAKELAEQTGAMVIASAVDAPVICGDESVPENTRTFTPCPVDHRVEDGDILKIGSLPWKVIATPGHTEGSICLFLDPQFGVSPAGAPVLIAGDTLFFGTIGRTDLPGGNMDAMKRSLKRLAVLPDETVVLPGHGNLTTIGAERTRVFAQFGEE